MNIIEKKVDEIIPYVNNPRNNELAVEAVAASIAEFGFKQPLVIDKNNIVVAGHTRLMAAKKLNLKTVPCVMADDLTEAQVKAYRLADNKVGELATWDMEKLELEMNDLDMDMAQFGFEKVGTSEKSETETGEDNSTSFNYESQYGVIVMCADEAEQEKIYNKLVGDGYTCKVVAV